MEKILREFNPNGREKYLTTQHERDDETGLDYRGARFYDSDVGRFFVIGSAGGRLSIMESLWVCFR